MFGPISELLLLMDKGTRLVTPRIYNRKVFRNFYFEGIANAFKLLQAS